MLLEAKVAVTGPACAANTAHRLYGDATSSALAMHNVQYRRVTGYAVTVEPTYVSSCSSALSIESKTFLCSTLADIRDIQGPTDILHTFQIRKGGIHYAN